MPDSKLSALSEISIPDFDDDVYLVDNTGPTSYKCGTDRLLALAGFAPGGRLTTESGVGVSSADRTSQGTLYYTPYVHNRIKIYDGTRWKAYVFTERSLSLSLTADKNYDVFIYDNSGTLTLELSAAWTNDSTRADALTTQDGIYVKSGATTRLWLGTIRSSGSNVTEDSLQRRFIYNWYNQVGRGMYFRDGTGHTYNSATIRNWNNVTTNRLHWVQGAAAGVIGGGTTSIKPGATGIPTVYYSIDWTSGVPSTVFFAVGNGDAALSTITNQTWGAAGFAMLAAGYHYMAPLEVDFNNQTSTFDNHISSAMVFQ